MIESKEFKNSSSKLTLCIGKNIEGKPIVFPLEKMPHLLVAGTTGSGKSACLHSLIISLLFKRSPDELRLILIDPKRVEFPFYKNLRHLLINKVINDRDQAVNAFKWIQSEMEARYNILQNNNVQNIEAYNNRLEVKSGKEEKMPYIVVVVDELNSLFQEPYKRDMSDLILSIAQLARACGIHLILATQRPSVDVLTGTIKGNLPARIALAVSGTEDSRTILGQGGAEALLGRGDLFFRSGESSDTTRIQGAYVTSDEIRSIVDYINQHNEENFNEEAERFILSQKSGSSTIDNSSDNNVDPLFEEVVRMVIDAKQASASMIQRRFNIGFNRASRIIDKMDELKFIGPKNLANPNKAREVFITKEMCDEFFL
jgi:S-DNA-T family DNA segregation ATPase FtsK/SpoIIIE